MSKLKFALPAMAILLAMAGTASASQTDSGFITNVDPARRMITLDDGATYRLSPAVNTADIAVGKEALVAYELTGGQPLAISVIAENYPLVDPSPAPGGGSGD